MTATPLNRFIVAAVVACASAGAFAQDAMKPAPMPRKDMTMQDCKDRMATAKGEKRADAAVSGEADKACADMMKNGHHKMKKHPMPKSDPAAMPDAPAK